MVNKEKAETCSLRLLFCVVNRKIRFAVFLAFIFGPCPNPPRGMIPLGTYNLMLYFLYQLQHLKRTVCCRGFLQGVQQAVPVAIGFL